MLFDQITNYPSKSIIWREKINHTVNTRVKARMYKFRELSIEIKWESHITCSILITHIKQDYSTTCFSFINTEQVCVSMYVCNTPCGACVHLKITCTHFPSMTLMFVSCLKISWIKLRQDNLFKNLSFFGKFKFSK